MTEPYALTTLMPGRTPRSPRWMLLLVAVLALLLLVSVGLNVWLLVGSRTGEPAIAAATPSALNATTTTAPPSTPPTTAPSTGPHRLGERVEVAGGTVDVAVLAYRQPIASEAPKPAAPGTEWGAADVQVCSRKETITVSEGPWVIAYADGGVIEPSSRKYVYFPEPEYPIIDRPVEAGRCVRGWIVFPALKGQRPATVEYAPQDLTPTVWSI